jgi:ferredoxin
VSKRTGIADAALEAGIECRELVDPIEVNLPEASRFKRLQIASGAMNADVIINLPKLKTHCQMLLTLGVKNMYGVIVGKQKVEWHHMAGVNRETFASLLLDVYAVTKPALTILDGIWGMEGRGPSNGTPRKLNLLAAAEDAIAMDIAVCRMLGGRRNMFPLYRAASDRGMGETDFSRITFPGLSPEAFFVNDFKFPELDSLHMFPASWDWFTRRFLVSKPVHRPSACSGCGRCEEICPEHAIERRNTSVRFNYSKCIRCYCCQEICPEDAIDFKKGMIVRLSELLERPAND